MTFVVTSGQLQAVQQMPDYAPARWGGYALTLTPAVTQTYEQVWRAQPAVRTVCGFLARNVAQLSLDPYRRLSATDREKALDHPLAAILERPVDGSKWTKYRLFNTLMQDLCVFDNAYWVKIRGDSGVRGVQPVPPRLIQPRGTNPFHPDYYRITGPRGYKDFAPDQVVHFHGYSPDDARMGVAPIETLRQILAEEYSASVYREQMWRNGARSAGFISRPKEAGKWSTDGRDRFKSDWRDLHTGDGLEVGTTPVLEDGMMFHASGVTPRDAQYVEARKLTREEVAVAYHVSPVMLGLMDGATFSNVTELHKMLYQDTLAPWLEQIQQDIEMQLLEDVDPGATRERRVYVEFNLRAKLQGSFEEQAKAMQSAVGAPWMARAEARAMHNLPYLDGTDELIVPLNVLEGGLASPNDTAPDEPSNEESNGQLPKSAVKGEPEATLRRYFHRLSKTVASHQGAGVTDVYELVDPDRWDTELEADLAAVGWAGRAAAINACLRVELATAVRSTEARTAVADLFDAYAERAQAIANEMEITP